MIIWDRETYWVQYGINTTLQYDSDVILGNDNVYATNEHYSINITGLTPFTTYYFIVWANNSIGNTTTDVMNFTTDQTGMRIILYDSYITSYFPCKIAPSVAPSNFEVVNITSTSIIFSWDALVDGANGIIQFYVITCESNITITVGNIHL